MCVYVCVRERVGSVKEKEIECLSEREKEGENQCTCVAILKQKSYNSISYVCVCASMRTKGKASVMKREGSGELRIVRKVFSTKPGRGRAWTFRLFVPKL